MGVTIQSKLSIQSLCNAKKVIANMPDNQDKTVVGTILGIAQSIVTRTSPDGTKTFEGISGQFEGVPTDPERDTVQSGICYLPDFVYPAIRELLLAENDKGERVNAQVTFGFEVALIRAKNPQGYSWQLTPLASPRADDPLSKLRAELTANRPRLIADNTAAKQEAAPKSGSKR
jgi:hypothetical protein